MRVKKYNKYQALLVLVFILLLFSYQARAEILINEITTASKDSTKDEFVELYNTSSSAVDLTGYALRKKTASGAESVLVSSSKFFGTISSHGYFVIAHPDYLSKINGDIVYSSSSYSIAENNTVLLYDNNGKLLDKVGWGAAKDFFGSAAANPSEGMSIGRLEGKDSEDNSKDFSLMRPTPGKKNEKYSEPVIEKKEYSKKLQITEILPNPENGSDEFIELYNGSDDKIDLENWSLHDASKTGEYIFPAKIIESKKYLVVWGDVFKFALNNGGDESVILKNPNGEIVFQIDYKGSKKGVSYNFDGNDWHWSKFLTPGIENVFEDVPEGEIEKDKKVYANVYAAFEIGGLSKRAKVTWDFGDGHKSYLQKTKHKYAKEGKYAASVKFSEGSEDIVKNFEVNVEEFPHPKLKITSASANPKGNDSGKEFLTIKNDSKKKIDLKDWSIATGWKKMINHPIKEEFILKKNEEKQITNEFASFYLNNSKAKIELRYPDGKVAYRFKYKKQDGIGEDEKFVHVKGEGWKWIAAENHESGITNQEKIQNADEKQEVINQQSSVIEENENIPTKEVVIENVKEDKPPLERLSLQSDVKFELLKNVSPSIVVHEENAKYVFTKPSISEQHYAVVFFKNISSNLNAKINLLLNYFLK